MAFLDAIGQAKKEEEQGRQAFIVPTDFWTDYKVKDDGSREPIDYVRWVKKGQQNPSAIDCSIPRMPKFYGIEWEVIKPFYEKWKAGQDAPIIGTPLAAWPGATPQLVKALEPVNIRSVDDFAVMEDSAITRIAIPGLRDKQRQARAFLEALKGTAAVSSEVAELRSQVEFLKAELKRALGSEDEVELPQSAAPVQPAVEPPRRKGGWPKGKPRKATMDHPAFNPDNDGTRVA